MGVGMGGEMKKPKTKQKGVHLQGNLILIIR